MSSLFNVYCDESCHLQNGRDLDFVMVIGGISCPANKKEYIFNRIREIKTQYGIARNNEIKWNKVSPAKYNYYKALIDFFFDNADLSFRAIVIDKRELDFSRFNLTNDDFYYRAYFFMLGRVFVPGNQYAVYIDIKDTKGNAKAQKLHEILCSSKYDFDRKMILKVQQVRSHEVELMGLTDLLIGALSYLHRGLDTSPNAKMKLIELIRRRSGYDLRRNTWLLEPKFNLFFWHGRYGK